MPDDPIAVAHGDDGTEIDLFETETVAVFRDEFDRFDVESLEVSDVE